MTIKQELQTLLNTKGEIRQAIIDKGVAVEENAPFDSYANKISQITGGSSGSSVAEYVYENTTETVAFPRKPSTESTDYMFTDRTSYKESSLEFSCYESNSSIEGMSYFFDGNLATNGNMINGLFFKFDKPVLLKKLYVYNDGGYQITLRGTNNPVIATDTSSNLWEVIYTGGAESYDVYLESKEYQYYWLSKNSGYKNIYELKFYAVVGNVTCTLKSHNMTPSIKCYPDNYMQVITQDWHNGSEIVPSQTLTFKTYEDGGCLVNYIDDGKAVNLKMFLMTGANTPIYVLAPDDDFTLEGYSEKTQVADLNIPAHLYKSVVFETFEQPVLTANGTIGGTDFAVVADSEIDDSRHAWKAFDGNTVLSNASTDQWHSKSGQPHWLEWYSPNILSVNKIIVFNGANNVLPLDWEVQYSDNNKAWTTGASGTNTALTANAEWEINNITGGYHKYWRFRTTSGSGGDSSYLGITELQISGVVQKETWAMGGGTVPPVTPMSNQK